MSIMTSRSEGLPQILIISSFRKGPSELARPSGSNCPSEDESSSGLGLSRPSSFLSQEGEEEREGSWRRQGAPRQVTSRRLWWLNELLKVQMWVQRY